eukprot:TRINITY_DN48542_c0_g1_i1.p1 TRINITY_DN48542_c0_g1~~TRINITY_DN48542_c0_g1_i1.p1  ORF type:complete len:1115 (+),score=145.76 TRINITY_DN48542_c0_g1_i1:118-3345(+)
MEAMYGFKEPLGMKYGRWYGEKCAGRRDGDSFPGGARRRIKATPWSRGATRASDLRSEPPVKGIEAYGDFSKVIATPFAMHDEHKDSWCPVANTLPAVKNKMGLTDAEAVSLFGAHSVGRVERAGNAPCNYMANIFYCPSMCPLDNGGMKYANGFVFDDSPDILDNRYFANIMDEDFAALPHCVALGATGGGGSAVPGHWDRMPDWSWTGLNGERNQGTVRFGVMGLGCGPVPWTPVTDPNATRTCTAGWKTNWKDQSQCEVNTCIHKCLTEGKYPITQVDTGGVIYEFTLGGLSTQRSEIQIKEHQYMLQADGRWCAAGWELIHDKEACQFAADSLGLDDPDGVTVHQGEADWISWRPPGCTWGRTMGTSGNVELWPATDGSKNSNHCGGFGLACICKRKAAEGVPGVQGVRVSEESKEFWVSVDTSTGILAAGSGHDITANEFMRLEVDSAQTSMNPLSFAVMGGGIWDFGGSPTPSPPGDKPCPDGYTQLGALGDDVPGWGFFSTTTSDRDACAAECSLRPECGSFEWNAAMGKKCGLNDWAHAVISAQTGTWGTVLTCKKLNFGPPEDGRYHTPEQASNVLKQGSKTYTLFSVMSPDGSDVSIGFFPTNLAEKTSACSHIWEDASQRCRDCKFDCDDFYDTHLPRAVHRPEDPRVSGRRTKDQIGFKTKVYNMGVEHWANTLKDYKEMDHGPLKGKRVPVASVEELRQFSWCKYMDSVEGVPLLGSGREGKGHDHLIHAPGPIAPDAREWGGPGLVMNMERFAFLHTNPTPIFNLPVDWTLLGKPETKRWVKAFGQDNSLFERTFATAWRKVISAGWDAKVMPTTGWTGARLDECKATKCTARDGKFWCPVDVLTDRLRYLPKPRSLRLVLGECLEGDPQNSASPGDCRLTGGYGVRGIIQCNSKTYHCCSERACEWERWLKKHRQADNQDGATCSFTKEEKQAEVDRTVKEWRPRADGLDGAGSPEDLGYDYSKPEEEVNDANQAHYDAVKAWYHAAQANGTLPKEFTCDWSYNPWQHCGGLFERLQVYNKGASEGEGSFYGARNAKLHWETSSSMDRPFNGDSQLFKPE